LHGEVKSFDPVSPVGAGGQRASGTLRFKVVESSRREIIPADRKKGPQ